MNNYSSHFTSKEAAEKYDLDEYAPGSYASLLTELEGELLEQLVPVAPTSLSTLDFACGTGRLTRRLPARCQPLVGIDISQEMVDRAAAADADGDYRRVDILAPSSAELGTFDCITAFRFILNADPELREQCLAALRTHTDAGGVLIVNNHGNRFSHHIVSYLLHRLGLRKATTTGKTLSHAEVVDLLATAGFQVTNRLGYGLVGGRLASRLGTDRTEKIERSVVARLTNRRLSMFTGHQLYLAIAV